MQRVDTTLFFNRSWAEMKQSIGSLSGNYWLGLDAIHNLTTANNVTLLVELTVPPVRDTQSLYDYTITYSTFQVGDEKSRYALEIGGFRAINDLLFDAFLNYNNYTFATWDNSSSGTNCPPQSGWWYGSSCTCDACLTQTPFSWSLGFPDNYLLTSARMTVQC